MRIPYEIMQLAPAAGAAGQSANPRRENEVQQIRCTFVAGLSIAVLASVGAGPAFAGPVTSDNGADQVHFNYRSANGTTFYNVQDLPGLQAPASLASQLSAGVGRHPQHALYGLYPGPGRANIAE